MNKLNMNTTQFKTAICNVAKKIKCDKLCCGNIDYIVTLAKGGYWPARLLAKQLKVDEIHSIGIRSYDGEEAKEPVIYQKLTKKFNESDVILIVDDIVDSGTTLDIAIKEVLEAGSKKIYTCSIHYKPKCKFEPGFYYKKVDNETWVNYPWE